MKRNKSDFQIVQLDPDFMRSKVNVTLSRHMGATLLTLRKCVELCLDLELLVKYLNLLLYIATMLFMIMQNHILAFICSGLV